MANPLAVWHLGDSAIAGAVAQFAASLGVDVISSAAPGATVESVWVRQLYDPRVRALATQPAAAPLLVVLYVAAPVYDSENTIYRIRQHIPEGSTVLVVVHPESSIVMEGFGHYRGDWLRVAVPETLDDVALAEFFQEMAR